jgi:hypothetical protein
MIRKPHQLRPLDYRCGEVGQHAIDIKTYTHLPCILPIVKHVIEEVPNRFGLILRKLTSNSLTPVLILDVDIQ